MGIIYCALGSLDSTRLSPSYRNTLSECSPVESLPHVHSYRGRDSVFLILQIDPQAALNDPGKFVATVVAETLPTLARVGCGPACRWTSWRAFSAGLAWRVPLCGAQAQACDSIDLAGWYTPWLAGCLCDFACGSRSHFTPTRLAFPTLSRIQRDKLRHHTLYTLTQPDSLSPLVSQQTSLVSQVFMQCSQHRPSCFT